MPTLLPLLIWDLKQFQWVWIIFLLENSGNGKTCSLWFPYMCKAPVGTQGWWMDCVSAKKFSVTQSTLHVLAHILKPSTATVNTWQCLAYVKQAKLHWLFHVLTHSSIVSHGPHKAQISLIHKYGNSSALCTHSAFSCHHQLKSHWFCCSFFS